MLENEVFNRPYVRDITKICECACSMNCDKNATELRPDRNPDIITNADRIRSMSDEDLANEMRKRSISTICDIVCQGECKAIATLNKTSNEVCKEIIMKWLQQPAEVGT